MKALFVQSRLVDALGMDPKAMDGPHEKGAANKQEMM